MRDTSIRGSLADQQWVRIFYGCPGAWAVKKWVILAISRSSLSRSRMGLRRSKNCLKAGRRCTNKGEASSSHMEWRIFHEFLDAQTFTEGRRNATRGDVECLAVKRHGIIVDGSPNSHWQTETVSVCLATLLHICRSFRRRRTHTLRIQPFKEKLDHFSSGCCGQDWPLSW
jgi:hypothetical protein